VLIVILAAPHATALLQHNVLFVSQPNFIWPQTSALIVALKLILVELITRKIIANVSSVTKGVCLAQAKILTIVILVNQNMLDLIKLVLRFALTNILITLLTVKRATMSVTIA
jgi:hypothetical protein